MFHITLPLSPSTNITEIRLEQELNTKLSSILNFKKRKVLKSQINFRANDTGRTHVILECLSFSEEEYGFSVIMIVNVY